MQRIYNLMAFVSFVATSTFVGIAIFSFVQLDRWEKEAVQRLGAGIKEQVEAELKGKLDGKLDGIKDAMPKATGPALPF